MRETTLEQHFTKIYDQYLNVIFLYFYSKTTNREQSKDLAQDTFIKAWNYIKSGHEVENMQGLLYKIANNTLVDWYRTRKNQSLDTLVEAGFDPIDREAVTDKHSEIQNILDHLTKLSDNDQQLIVWRFVEGLTPQQISENLQQNKNAVSVMVHRAVNRLRNLAVGQQLTTAE